MRTLLRSIRSGEYLQSFESWTASAGTALDFESIARALDLVRRRGLRDMELVLTDEPSQTTVLPVAKLDYAAAFIEEIQPRQKPRLKKLDGHTGRTAAVLAPPKRKPPRRPAKPATARRKPRPTAKSRARR